MVVDGKDYTSEHILIASGGHPAYPKIPGADLGITSDGFFLLERQPKKGEKESIVFFFCETLIALVLVAVVGAGYIAVELAGIFNALGTDTTLVIRTKRVLRHFDEIISDAILEEMKNAGIKIVTDAVSKEVCFFFLCVHSIN